MKKLAAIIGCAGVVLIISTGVGLDTTSAAPVTVSAVQSAPPRSGTTWTRCDVGLHERITAAQDSLSVVNADLNNGGLINIFTRVRICPGERVTVGVPGEFASIRTPKEAGVRPAAFQPGVDQIVTSSCNYAVFSTGEYTGNTKLYGRGTITCPVVATLKSETCVGRVLSGGSNVRLGCNTQQYSNVPANSSR